MHDSPSGHIFPESHQPHLGSSSRLTDATGPSGSNRQGSQGSAVGRSRNPKSHPILVTGEDIEHSLSELDLGRLTPLGDETAGTSRQASQSSMLHQQIPYPSQQHATGSRRGSRNASFTGGAAGRRGVAGQHRRSSSGEEQSAATSHFKLPPKQLHARQVMQEPPLSTRSSYRMESWDQEPQGNARSYGPSGALPHLEPDAKSGWLMHTMLVHLQPLAEFQD